jgi:redox-sensing transcriptional repressor
MRFDGAEAVSHFEEKLDATRGLVTAAETGRQLPGQKMRRLHGYLLALDAYVGKSIATVSSQQLARGVGVRASLVRRDLSEIGGFGTPGRGYDVGRLTSEIRRALHLQRTRRAVWLGDASALRGRRAVRAAEVANCGLVGVFDDKSAGRSVNGYVVQPLSKAATEARKRSATVAVLASEEAADPKLLSRLVAAGIQAVLNLTPARLELPAAVVVEQCDLGSQLLRLISRMGADAEG